MSKFGKMEDLNEEIQPLGIKPIKVIAVSAGKGGVGKSSIAINLAVSLAQMNKKILLLDADLALANLDIMLGLCAKFNLSHVIQGVCSLVDTMLVGPQTIRIIPAASGTDYMTQLNPLELAGIIDSFNHLTEEFDYMIIDTAAGISEIVLSFIRSAQELIVIISDEPTSLTDSYALMKVMSRRYEWDKFHILVNRVKNAREGKEIFYKLYKAADLYMDITLSYLGMIPYDEHVHEAVKRQKAVVEIYPQSKAAKAFEKLAKKVEEWPFRQELRGNTSFFLERLALGRHDETLQ